MKALILEKRVSRKDTATQRKEEKSLGRLNKKYELQFIADDAGNSLHRRVFARVFFSVNPGSLWLFLFFCLVPVYPG